MKANVTIEIDTDQLYSLTDERLATAWAVAQANPLPIEDRAAGELAEAIGREIIRRWLSGVTPELWHHQGRHYFWSILAQHGKWQAVNGEDSNREWTPNVPEAPNAA